MNKKCIIFFSIFFIAYLSQQFGRREDWPLTYFGMYKGGRLHTQPYYKLNIYYHRKDLDPFDVYVLRVDYFYLNDKLETILLERKWKPNNDIVKYGLELDYNKQEEVSLFFKKDIIPLLKKNNIYEKGASISLNIRYWDDMKFENYHHPDKNFIYYKEVL